MSISRTKLLQAFDSLLQPERFKDYGPNGLQVEGKAEISRIVSGVTASRALIDAAIAAQADAIFVHHGLFWRGQDGRVTGWMKQRLQLLLAHDINLFAYHLPLDAHPELGNNAQLGRVLGLVADARFGENDLGFAGPAAFADGQALADHVAQALGRPVTGCRRKALLRSGQSAAWPGAQEARRATSRRRLRLGPTCSSPARFPSPRRIWPARWGWVLSPQGTTRPSVMGRLRWRRRLQGGWGWATNSSRSTILPDRW